MIVIKYILITLSILYTGNSFGQDFIHNAKKLTTKSKKGAKKELIRILKYEELENWIDLMAYVSKLNYNPVSSFILSAKAIEYDSTKRIVDFIIPNDKVIFEFALTFNGKSYEGLIDCIDAVSFGSKDPCSYDNSKIMEGNHMNTFVRNGFSVLAKRKVSLLFTVKYIRNCWWFVEEGNVFILDLKELRIYNPDEYIKLKCSIQNIRDLAKGNLSKFCN